MQFFILLLGAMVFVFFEFNTSPVNFNPQVISYMEEKHTNEFNVISKQYDEINSEKEDFKKNF